MFMDPCLVVVWVGGDVDGGELGDGVGCASNGGRVQLKLECSWQAVLCQVCRWLWSPHSSGRVGGNIVVCRGS